MMMAENLPDYFDQQILKCLEPEGQMAFSDIATQLNISNTMVHQRVSKMQEKGIITQFSPILDERKLGYDWATFTGITLDKDHPSERIIEELSKVPEVTA